MTVANKTVQSGSAVGGWTTPDTKDHQTFVEVDGADGHIKGTRPEYSFYYAPTTIVAAAELGEIFNTTTTPVRIRGIWIFPTHTIVTGYNLGIDINRITTVGNGATTSTARPFDTSAPAIAAGITGRKGSTTGATLSHLYWTAFIHMDELATSAANVAVFNQLPVLGDRSVEIVLRQNQGLQLKVGATGTIPSPAGAVGVLIYFVVDN